MHKARKIYAIKLINGSENESFVVRYMGHTPVDYIKNYYYFVNKSHKDSAKEIENAISY